jgi:hypothetical protein
MTVQGGEHGVEVRGSVATFEDVVVTANAGSVSGAGVGAYDGAKVDLVDCDVSGNAAVNGFSGGGIYVALSSLTATRCTVSANTANQGGGVYGDDAVLVFQEVVVSDNEADTYGGGFRLRNGSSLTATTVSVERNYAASGGGGLHGEDSDTSWTGSALLDNTSDGSGGGMDLDDQLSLGTSFEGSISGNRAVGSGGGVRAWRHDVALSGTLDWNSAGTGAMGGGLYAGDAVVLLSSLTVANNQAPTGGGAYGDADSTVAVDAASFLSNAAEDDGGGLAT